MDGVTLFCEISSYEIIGVKASKIVYKKWVDKGQTFLLINENYTINEVLNYNSRITKNK